MDINFLLHGLPRMEDNIKLSPKLEAGYKNSGFERYLKYDKAKEYKREVNNDRADIMERQKLVPMELRPIIMATVPEKNKIRNQIKDYHKQWWDTSEGQKLIDWVNSKTGLNLDGVTIDAVYDGTPTWDGGWKRDIDVWGDVTGIEVPSFTTPVQAPVVKEDPVKALYTRYITNKEAKSVPEALARAKNTFKKDPATAEENYRRFSAMVYGSK